MIRREDVIHMAELARLELSDEEIELYLRDMNNFLAAGRKLQQVDVSGIAGTSHAVTVEPVLRRDEVGESLPALRFWRVRLRLWTAFSRFPASWRSSNEETGAAACGGRGYQY